MERSAHPLQSFGHLLSPAREKVPCTVVKGVYCVEVKQGSNLYGQNVSKRYIQERWLKCQVDFWPGQCIIDAEIKQGSDIVGKKNAEKI